MTIMVPMTRAGKNLSSREKTGRTTKEKAAVRTTAPVAVRRPCCSAMAMNRMSGAPPGSITNGSRGPNFHGPSDWISDPTPESTNAAESRLTVRPASSRRVALIRKIAEMGVAAMTRTC